MGKIYQFPNRQKSSVHKPEAYSESKRIMEDVMGILVENYKRRIVQLQEYKDEIKKMDGRIAKSPKELIKLVRELNKMFYKYGISCNFYRFGTLQNTEIIYFNDRKLVYVYEEGNKDVPKHLTIGQFVQELEYYKFTLMLDEDVYEVLDTQMNKLETTIETLKNTKI